MSLRTICALLGNTLLHHTSTHSTVSSLCLIEDVGSAAHVKLQYLLLDHAGGLIVEDRPQPVGVSCSFWIQAEVQGHINGGEFIPELFLILQTKETEEQSLCRQCFSAKKKKKKT